MLKVFLLLLLTNALTQFSCDFETPEQRQAWVLNAGRDGVFCTNRWSINEAGANQGHYGLFISFDSIHARYLPDTVGGVVSYTTLDMAPQDYTLSFSWQSLGFQRDTALDYDDRLYVCWIPTLDADDKKIELGSRITELPKFVTTYAMQPHGSKYKYLAGSQSWSTAMFDISSTMINPDKGPYRLLFAWKNGDSMAVNPPAMVDNIEIIPADSCSAPSDLYYELVDQTIHVHWTGTAHTYEVRCYNHESHRNYTRTVTDTTDVVFDEVPEGRVDIYVRALCDDFHSPAISTTGLVYYPGTRCINFLDIKAAKTYIGKDFHLTTDPVQFSEKLVDFGYASSYSRHTVHYDRDELDAQTNYGLPTVPDDEIASVRLGNWRPGTECERIEYTLHIDAEVNPVLVLKYAVVMENPDGHSTYQQPRFTLRILKNGKSVGNPCVEADFTADKVDTLMKTDKTWHRWNPHTSAASADIVWKEWTTVGVDLSEYDGEDLVVQLTSYDCSESGHFGYVYFTLSCSNGKFKDMSCGEINPVFYAPAGFLYRWYPKSDPSNIISRIDTLEVGYQDTLTYGCDLMFPKDTTCYFTLYADAMARFPIPELSYRVKHDCNNVVHFTEKSHLLVRNHISGVDTHDYKQYCDYTEWTFHDGTSTRDAEIVKEYPPEGGTFAIVLHAYYVTCDSIDTVYITLPRAMPNFGDTVKKMMCESETPFIFPSVEDPNHLTLYESGQWKYVSTNQYGCDSTVVVDLAVVENQFIAQRWNDVLAVRNSAYNGGYTFVTYQWVKDGVDVPGEKSPTLYVAGGLDTTAIYTVRLTRTDGEMMESCPYHPKRILSNDLPIVVQAGQSIPMRGRGVASFYSVLGGCVSEQPYCDTSIEAPASSGLFLMQCMVDQSVSQTRYIIVR